MFCAWFQGAEADATVGIGADEGCRLLGAIERGTAGGSNLCSGSHLVGAESAGPGSNVVNGSFEESVGFSVGLAPAEQQRPLRCEQRVGGDTLLAHREAVEIEAGLSGRGIVDAGKVYPA